MAAYDPGARRLVIVAVNTGAAQTLTFDLSRFGQVTGGTGGLVPRWSTVPARRRPVHPALRHRLSGKTVARAVRGAVGADAPGGRRRTLSRSPGRGFDPGG